MPGLLSQQPGGAVSGGGPVGPAAAPAAGVPAPAEGVGGEQPNVSPDEQRQYDAFVNNALLAISDQKALPMIVESLKGDGNPVEGLANTAVTVVVRVQDSAQQAGQQITPDVVFHAGTEILEALAELASRAGVHEFTPEEVESALYQAMDLYRGLKGKEMDQAPFAEDFKQLEALDQAGRIDELAPGLTAKFGGGAPGAQGTR